MAGQGRYVRCAASALVVFGALAIFAVAPAGAATIKTTGSGLKYTAGSGEANEIAATAAGGKLTLADVGAAAFDRALPSGCVANAVDVGVSATCNFAGDQTLTVDLGDGDDYLDGMQLPRRIDLVVTTGDGINYVTGGGGDDRITGAAGDDTLYGGPGTDVLVGHGGSNWLRGNGGDDTATGGSGIDFLFGDGGADELNGGGELDFITGGSGDDTLNGGAGDDDIGAGKGDDVVNGGAGDDELRGGKGEDQLNGGAGDDLLRARDGEGDTLNCGAGDDIARVDAGEVDQAKRSCETVKQADSTPVEPADQDTIILS